MCGIAGFWQLSGLGSSARNIIESMIKVIERRGPDDSGIFMRPESGIAIGHRRLAINDLSPAGAQPMKSSNGRYIIVYNGEIYNFSDMKNEFSQIHSSHIWRGSSDTEVLLESIAQWGIYETLKKVDGMFAFALWDELEQTITLARDRMGEKPLYYCWSGAGDDRALIFGSDISSIQAHPIFNCQINADAVEALHSYSYIPEPLSIYKGVEKLMPGTYIKYYRNERLERHVYWDTLKEYAAIEMDHKFSGSFSDAVDELQLLLKASIKRQAIADVPLGAFLSGGIDSSLVTSLLNEETGGNAKSFSIGFSDKTYDESGYARAIASLIGTEHHELIISTEQAMSIIPDLPNIYSEPFADSSQIPTFLVSKMARQSVTVALSGDGGDELFGGYNRYIHGANKWEKISAIPHFVRNGLASLVRTVPHKVWDSPAISGLIGVPGSLADRVSKSTRAFSSRAANDMYQELTSIDLERNNILNIKSDFRRAHDLDNISISNLSLSDKMMASDLVQYLPGDILVKVDRAAMANSLETRVPMLGVDVMRFAWSLPSEYKIQNGKGKIILRELLNRYIPISMFDRPKQGFSIPLDQWLRGGLRSWATSLIEDREIPLEEFYNAALVRLLWKHHLAGDRNHQQILWPVLMFQAWRRSML